jgi:TonB family protein
VAKVYAETKVHAEKFAGEKFPASAAVANPTPAAATRATLPPMSVEVIAGDAHHTLRPGSNAVKVEIPHASGPASNAAELERMSSGVANQPDSYPMLAQRARVEGSVVLQALIGADGVIRDLRVLSGPSILTAAAQQAVRQWRFKPYLENGQPVETKAHITVSFTIKVSDNAKST